MHQTKEVAKLSKATDVVKRLIRLGNGMSAVMRFQIRMGRRNQQRGQRRHPIAAPSLLTDKRFLNRPQREAFNKGEEIWV
jgi:hypothetical protein